MTNAPTGRTEAAPPDLPPGSQPGSEPGSQPGSEPVTDLDRRVVAEQLGREPRGMRAVAHRCPCGNPDVVQTSPRLPDGTPFPTLWYLTCPRATSAVGRLEANGVMREMTARLDEDADLAAAYQQAHDSYLEARDSLEPLGRTITAGGMPDRVKCLHVLVAHSLACGRGVNPFGDEAVEAIGEYWAAGPCVDRGAAQAEVGARSAAEPADGPGA